MTSRRLQPGREIAIARDQFVWLMGGLGLAIALGTGLMLALGFGSPSWLTTATTLSAGIAALLVVDLMWALRRHRHWAALLMRLAMLLINAIFFFVELLALLSMQRAR
jgi:hypothetical protein